MLDIDSEGWMDGRMRAGVGGPNRRAGGDGRPDWGRWGRTVLGNVEWMDGRMG